MKASPAILVLLPNINLLLQKEILVQWEVAAGMDLFTNAGIYWSEESTCFTKGNRNSVYQWVVSVWRRS